MSEKRCCNNGSLLSDFYKPSDEMKAYQMVTMATLRFGTGYLLNYNKIYCIVFYSVMWTNGYYNRLMKIRRKGSRDTVSFVRVNTIYVDTPNHVNDKSHRQFNHERKQDVCQFSGVTFNKICEVYVHSWIRKHCLRSYEHTTNPDAFLCVNGQRIRILFESRLLL